MTSPKIFQELAHEAVACALPHPIGRLRARQHSVTCFVPSRQGPLGPRGGRPRLTGLAVQHRGGEARYAGELAIGPMDFSLPDLGAPAEMKGPAQRSHYLALRYG